MTSETCEDAEQRALTARGKGPGGGPGEPAPGPLDDLFHWCALAAFIDAARACGGWPDSEEVRRRAYGLYEAELRAKNASRQQALDGATILRHVVETTPGRE